MEMVTPDLERLLGRKPKSIDKVVRENSIKVATSPNREMQDFDPAIYGNLKLASENKRCRSHVFYGGLYPRFLKRERPDLPDNQICKTLFQLTTLQ